MPTKPAIVSDPRILHGMQAQLKVRQSRLDAGQKSVGWKIGFGTPAALESLHLDGPLIGFITDTTLLSNGSSVNVADWAKPVVEPEIAVYLAHDLPGGTDREAARAAIAALGPAIELADVSFPSDDVEAILAGNIYNRHVILGRADSSRAGCVLDGLIAHIIRGGEVSTITDLLALTGDPIELVRHVADVLAAFGETLRAGEWIITGSIVPHLRVTASETIGYALDPIDTLSVTLKV